MPLHRPAFLWILDKELRELFSSRSWWVFLILMGPLVGVSFISAVHTYAEASGFNGTAAGVGEAFSPLIGIWAPTFSACELGAAFLFPFVAIRQFAGDRQSGALKIEIQHPMPALMRVMAKALVLLAGWGIASLAPFAAVLLWRSYGGSIYFPELTTVVAGHLLNACLTIALAALAASIADNPSTAAILTLSVTVGSWIINFVAAIHGGLWEVIAGYTPTAMVSQFQHALVRSDTLLVALTLILTGFCVAAIWMRLGDTIRRRSFNSVGVIALGCCIVFACTFAKASWDLSENRMNSFSLAEEAALRQVRSRLSIQVHLAPEDPRRVDLDHRAISKLLRVMPAVKVEYQSVTSTGIFEQTRENYGEIWYDMDGRRVVSRATTEEGVLEAIYSVSRVAPPPENEADIYRGHPLAVPPKGATVLFYGIWPALTAVLGIFVMRRSK